MAKSHFLHSLLTQLSRIHLSCDTLTYLTCDTDILTFGTQNSPVTLKFACDTELYLWNWN